MSFVKESNMIFSFQLRETDSWSLVLFSLLVKIINLSVFFIFHFFYVRFWNSAPLFLTYNILILSITFANFHSIHHRQRRKTKKKEKLCKINTHSIHTTTRTQKPQIPLLIVKYCAILPKNKPLTYHTYLAHMYRETKLSELQAKQLD